jgi:glycosyltransferase involved in cell wall biosynthesis
MKIAVDFREGAKAKRAGKAEYVFQLVSALLLKLADTDELLLVVEKGQIINLPAGCWRPIIAPVRGGWWHLWVAGWLTLRRAADVYFSTTSVIVPALAFRVPIVMTIFDFTVWRYSAIHLPRAIMIEKLLMARALRHSQQLIAISEFTKREVLELFGVNPDKIIVTWLGADERFQHLSLSPDAIVRLQTKYHLPPRFLLYLGTLEPRKNLIRTVRAFLQARSNLGEHQLVLAGALGWHTKVNELNEPGVVLTGYIDAADRPGLYNLATALVFPSLYEGFGLPPLEAMACGTPVITSRVSSLPEVVGSAAMLVDPQNEAAIAEAMVEIVSSSELRARLATEGLTRAAQFSWSKCAEQTLEVLRMIISHG